MYKRLIALSFTVPLLLTACSSQNESNLSTTSSATDMASESAVPQLSESMKDPCEVLDEMQLSLSTAVGDLVANPDLSTAFEAEFENQVALLNDLIGSLQGDSAEQQQLQTDLDLAVLAKEDALRTFTDAQQSDNAFAVTLGMADAALLARDAVIAAEKVINDLNGQLQCTP